MPITPFIGISAEREIGCQLFIATVTEIQAFMGPPPARRARAPVGHPSGPRGACGARGVGISAWRAGPPAPAHPPITTDR